LITDDGRRRMKVTSSRMATARSSLVNGLRRSSSAAAATSASGGHDHALEPIVLAGDPCRFRQLIEIEGVKIGKGERLSKQRFSSTRR
jgi:hypothetical protein